MEYESAALTAAHQEVVWGYRLANVLSYLINPLCLPPLAFALALAHLGASPVEIGQIVVLSTIFFVLVPFAYVLNMVRTGETLSVEVPERRKRMRPLMVGLTSFTLATITVGLASQTATPFLISLVAINVINTVVLIAINSWWKISIHLVGLAAFISTLFFVASISPERLGAPGALEFQLTAGPLLALLSLVPVLMWARVRVGAHTIAQVTGGAILGLVLPYVQLLIFVNLLPV